MAQNSEQTTVTHGAYMAPSTICIRNSVGIFPDDLPLPGPADNASLLFSRRFTRPLGWARPSWG